MNTPVIPLTLIQSIALKHGYRELRPNVSKSLSNECEIRIRKLIQDATKFMRRSKRSELTDEDISLALKLRNHKPLFGLIASKAPGGDDQMVDLTELMDAPLPELPSNPVVSIHWLAIDGVQPRIPENDCKEIVEAVLGSGGAAPDIKPIAKHELSLELQQFFDETVKVLFSPESKRELVSRCLQGIASGEEMHQLLPYFVQVVRQRIAKSLRNLPALFASIQILSALMMNDRVHPELHLHHILPATLTCLLGRRLCLDPAVEDHWELRDLAARLLQIIIRKFSSKYPDLTGRVTAKLREAFLSTKRPLTTHYGAIRGLTALGQRTVLSAIVPELKKYYSLLQPLLSVDEPKSQAIRLEASHVESALLESVALCLNDTESATDSSGMSSKQVLELGAEVFGEKMQVWVKATTDEYL